MSFLRSTHMYLRYFYKTKSSKPTKNLAEFLFLWPSSYFSFVSYLFTMQKYQFNEYILNHI